MTAMMCQFKHGRSGYQKHGCRCDVCKGAQSDYKKLYRRSNLEKCRRQEAEWRDVNRESMRKRDRDRYKNNPVDRERRRKRSASAETHEYKKAYDSAHRDEISKKAKERRAKNPSLYRERVKTWRSNNRDKVNANERRYMAERRRDPVFRLQSNLRRRVSRAITRGGKSDKTMSLLGCSMEKMMAHLESQFQQGMTWENYGINGWHVDHIIPCSSFDLTNCEQQRKCFHFTNLQPLWAEDNLKKSNKIAA